ncbi:1-deoxy-D-xylulose-5-phosphate reductoisomerase [bacterium]|nr:1-deoxy-D-xylulose-5-phosphate reductoisomerase [candidate division CSSED10-310 bacterium]
MKNIVILGCSGSIGSQTLDVAAMFPDCFRITGISAKGTHPDKLAHIIRDFQPACVVVEHESVVRELTPLTEKYGGTITTGQEKIEKLAAGQLVPVDVVVSAQSGISGVRPTIAALEAGVDVALANKETLVTGGEWAVSISRRTGSKLLPVDSEHCAISQCLAGVESAEVNRLILTCSGGPFHNHPDLDLETIPPSRALAHPTWTMGRKISIDSATLMNKGLEIIEARWLFDMPQEKIDVIIHPQSIIHSMVETRDGSVMAQLSTPDMRHPILYALSAGHHWPAPLPALDLTSIGSLTFSTPDTGRFPCLNLARQALIAGGTMTAVLNTANELAVDAYCAGKIGFMDIARVIESAMDAHLPVALNSLETISEVEIWTRSRIASQWAI